MIHSNECPYCGHNHSGIHAVGDKFFVRCFGCQLMGPNCETRDEAVAVWNRIKIEKNESTALT